MGWNMSPQNLYAEVLIPSTFDGTLLVNRVMVEQLVKMESLECALIQHDQYPYKKGGSGADTQGECHVKMKAVTEVGQNLQAKEYQWFPANP